MLTRRSGWAYCVIFSLVSSGAGMVSSGRVVGVRSSG
ncbi:Uncharacterised protein [Mycobacteroides abscessus]|nr:Uncharacterised protein [Mycobacteroides abscessus]